MAGVQMAEISGNKVNRRGFWLRFLPVGHVASQQERRQSPPIYSSTLIQTAVRNQANKRASSTTGGFDHPRPGRYRSAMPAADHNPAVDLPAGTDSPIPRRSAQG